MLTDTDTGKPISLSSRYAFIQLPAFNIDREEDCHSDFDKLIFSLKNMKDMQTMPFTSHNDIFQRLANVGNIANLSPAERTQYEYDLKKARDYSAEMSYARKTGHAEGHAEGRAKGRAEGRAEGYQEAVLKLLQSGCLTPEVAKSFIAVR